MAATKKFRILLVEDDPGHARLIEKNLRRANVHNEIILAQDGQQAIDYLFRQDQDGSGNGKPPLVVLLDLNLPVLDGYQVLQRIKGDDRTRYIPVIVLTTADDDLDVSRCYALGCNFYVTKPIDYDQFAETIRRLGQFVLVTAVPHRG